MSKEAVFESIEADRDRLSAMARHLWKNPELGLREEESAETLADALSDAGFSVERGVGGMPTAFVASFEHGTGDPTIGILGEYDALPGLSQEVSATREPVEEGAPGHGCGHNLFGVAGVGAAIALREVVESADIDATIRFYGCPAEETLTGKVYMARAGVFDDLDAALTWHPSDITRPQLTSSLALDSIQFTFEGRPAHAAQAPTAGRSALDAVQLMNLGVEHMREHVGEKARIHYTIPDGGGAPNVVPRESTVWYFVRAPTRSQVERLSEWVADVAEGAALMTQTEVDRRYVTGCWEFLVNETLIDVMWETIRELGPIDYDEADYEFARDLRETVSEAAVEQRLNNLSPGVRRVIRDEALHPDPIAPAEEVGLMMGSTEVGDVSWIAPTAQCRIATWPVGVTAHTWQAVAASGGFGIKGAVYAAKVLGGTAYDLLTDPDRLAEATAEFERVAADIDYETPLPEGIEPPFDVGLD